MCFWDSCMSIIDYDGLGCWVSVMNIESFLHVVMLCRTMVNEVIGLRWLFLLTKAISQTR